MKKVVRKFFWDWDFDKEEQWLNEMADKGFVLTYVGVTGKYTFDECQPGEYTIRTEKLKYRVSHPESQRYIKFIEETGAEKINSRLDWVYFKKKNDGTPFELYSDNKSKIKQLNRLLVVLLMLALFNLYIGGLNIYMAVTGFSRLSNFNYIGIFNVTFSILAFYGCYKLYKKRKKLKQESDIFE